MIDTAINSLNFLGFTPSQHPFFSLGVLILLCAGYLGVKLNKIKDGLGKVKDNVLVVITHLSSAASSRGRLDTALIKSMSPMTITPQGHAVLTESGFRSIIDDQSHRSVILRYLSRQNPQTKLDVENLAIVSFATVLELPFMAPIKSYLYEHPNERESYVTLAGVCIRDEYLKDHPEITR